MSKSLGNIVDPNEVSSKSGSEIIRLWTAYSDYGNDIGCGKEELTRVTETYRKIRNTMRFLLGSTSDFDFSKDQIAVEKMTQVDQWMMHQLNQLITEVTASYEKYEFFRVYHLLNNFFTVTLSATYMDILKDRLYTWKADGLPRRSSQTALYHVTTSLITMMAPILSFLAEETYSYLKSSSKKESVFLEDFPLANPTWNKPELAATFEKILAVRGDVQKKLEELRTAKTIGASLEAKVVITAEGDVLQALNKASDLREILIVSDLKVSSGAYSVTATKAEGDKCVRCWVYSTAISTLPATLGVCPKCVDALTGTSHGAHA
jgi:isoleucyl-tRNA synthetase